MARYKGGKVVVVKSGDVESGVTSRRRGYNSWRGHSNREETINTHQYKV